MAHTFPPLAVQLIRPSSAEQVAQPLRLLEGAVPEGLRGHVFGTMPCRHAGVNPDEVIPFLNGAGAVYRVSFDGDGADPTFLLRLLQTPSTVADEAIEALAAGGGAARKARFENFGITRFSSGRLGAANMANTALVAFRGQGDDTPRLLATYDAGRPFEIDPVTLRVLGPVGRQTSWRGSLLTEHPLPQVFSTAHPAWDPQTEGGVLWGVNTGRSKKSMMGKFCWLTKRAQRLAVQALPLLGKSARRLVDDLGPDVDEEVVAGLGEAGLLDLDMHHLEALVDALDAEDDRIDEEGDPLDKSGAHEAELQRWFQSDDIDPGPVPAGTVEALHGDTKGLRREEAGVLRLLFAALKTLTYIGSRFKQPGPTFAYLNAWSGRGEPRVWQIEVGGKTLYPEGSLHQLAVTEHHVVLADTSFKFEADAILPFDRIFDLASKPKRKKVVRALRLRASRPQPAPAIYLARKPVLDSGRTPDPDLKEKKRFKKLPSVDAVKVVFDGDLPAFVHLFADYDETHTAAGPRLVLHVAHNELADAGEFLMSDDRRWDRAALPAHVLGMFCGAVSRNSFSRIEVDPATATGHLTAIPDNQRQWGLGLGSAAVPADPGVPAQAIASSFWYTHGLVSDLVSDLAAQLYARAAGDDWHDFVAHADQGVPARLVRMDHAGPTVGASYTLPEGHLVVSPQHVPGPEGGWVVATVLSPDPDEPSQFWAWPADLSSVACKLGLPIVDGVRQRVSYTLHTAHLPTLAQGREYHGAADRDFPPEDDPGGVIGDVLRTVRARAYT